MKIEQRKIVIRDDETPWPNEINREMRVLNKLRDAGIPVAGHLFFCAPLHGSITVERIGTTRTYTWTPGLEDDEI